jgi:hypothetical protein
MPNSLAVVECTTSGGLKIPESLFHMNGKTRTRLDLWKLAYTIREKLGTGVELSDGRLVAVHLAKVYFVYVEARGNEVKAKYVGRCASVHVDAVVDGKDVKITNVDLSNCEDCVARKRVGSNVA